MKNLNKKLEKLRLIKEIVNSGKTKRGYSAAYQAGFGGGRIKVEYRDLNEHLLVELRYAPIVHSALGIFELGEEEKAKEFCYKRILSYLWRETHVIDGELWDKKHKTYKLPNGERRVLSVHSGIFKTSPWWGMDDKTRERTKRRLAESKGRQERLAELVA